MLLFGVLTGEYQLDPLLLLEGPQSRWALPRSPITWKTSFLLSARSESPSRMLPRTSTTHRCCQQELGLFLGTQQGEPGTGRSLDPSWPRCCSHGSPEPAWKWEGASPVGSAEPASDLCLVHSSVVGAAQLCFVFSLGISSRPSLSTILPWNHDYRCFLCRCLPGGCSSPPYRVACSLG